MQAKPTERYVACVTHARVTFDKPDLEGNGKVTYAGALSFCVTAHSCDSTMATATSIPQDKANSYLHA